LPGEGDVMGLVPHFEGEIIGSQTRSVPVLPGCLQTYCRPAREKCVRPGPFRDIAPALARRLPSPSVGPALLSALPCVPPAVRICTACHYSSSPSTSPASISASVMS
jgi:hypothetical protein